jgi:hypothetical protein
MTEDEVREELLKLTVGKGGKPSHRRLTPEAEVSLFESSREGQDEGFPYVIVLRFDAAGQRREQKVHLRLEQVYTRTKGAWVRDSVWRLTPESAASFATQITAVLRRIELGPLG